MKILAIDTSSTACSVAFLDNNEVKLRHEVIPMQHAKCLLSFIDEILGSEINHLDALAWGCGPGSFTGLRIAASVVQALGFARQLPVINVSSLAAVAQTAYQAHGWKQMLVALDARMQEMYWATYSINAEGYAELVNSEMMSAPNEIPPGPLFKREGSGDFFMPEKWYGVGNAWSVYQAELTDQLQARPESIDADCLPKALAIAELGRIKYEKGEWVKAIDALPMYLRDNICKIS